MWRTLHCTALHNCAQLWRWHRSPSDYTTHWCLDSEHCITLIETWGRDSWSTKKRPKCQEPDGSQAMYYAHLGHLELSLYYFLVKQAWDIWLRYTSKNLTGVANWIRGGKHALNKSGLGGLECLEVERHRNQDFTLTTEIVCPTINLGICTFARLHVWP